MPLLSFSIQPARVESRVAEIKATRLGLVIFTPLFLPRDASAAFVSEPWRLEVAADYARRVPLTRTRFHWPQALPLGSSAVAFVETAAHAAFWGDVPATGRCRFAARRSRPGIRFDARDIARFCRMLIGAQPSRPATDEL